MKILVTGKSGSGKSTFSKALANELNFKYIDLDEVGHKFYDEEENLKKISSLFGNKIFDDDGKFNRKKLGKIIFENPETENVKTFNEITWVFMKEAIERETENVIIDFVLLPETEYWNNENFKIYVYANDEKRFEKLLKRDNLSTEYLKLRDNASCNFDNLEFDFIFKNSYNKEELEKTIKALATKIKNIK